MILPTKACWKWMKGVDNEFPSEVKWIKTSLHGTNSKLPEDLPNPEDVEKLITAATNTRDKVLVSVLYDSGCGIGRILKPRCLSEHIFSEVDEISQECDDYM